MGRDPRTGRWTIVGADRAWFPRGIAIDRFGRVWVTGRGVLDVYDPSTQTWAIVSVHLLDEFQPATPVGLAIDEEGKVHVKDTLERHLVARILDLPPPAGSAPLAMARPFGRLYRWMIEVKGWHWQAAVTAAVIESGLLVGLGWLLDWTWLDHFLWFVLLHAGGSGYRWWHHPAGNRTLVPTGPLTLPQLVLLGWLGMVFHAGPAALVPPLAPVVLSLPLLGWSLTLPLTLLTHLLSAIGLHLGYNLLWTRWVGGVLGMADSRAGSIQRPAWFEELASKDTVKERLTVGWKATSLSSEEFASRFDPQLSVRQFHARLDSPGFKRTELRNPREETFQWLTQFSKIVREAAQLEVLDHELLSWWIFGRSFDDALTMRLGLPWYLKVFRFSRGLTIERLASEAQIPQLRLGRYELGHDVPRFLTLRRLANFYGEQFIDRFFWGVPYQQRLKEVETVNERIDILRLVHELTIQELAKRAGLSRKSLESILDVGHTIRQARPQTVWKIARALKEDVGLFWWGVPLDEAWTAKWQGERAEHASAQDQKVRIEMTAQAAGLTVSDQGELFNRLIIWRWDWGGWMRNPRSIPLEKWQLMIGLFSARLGRRFTISFFLDGTPPPLRVTPPRRSVGVAALDVRRWVLQAIAHDPALDPRRVDLTSEYLIQRLMEQLGSPGLRNEVVDAVKELLAQPPRFQGQAERILYIDFDQTIVQGYSPFWLTLALLRRHPNTRGAKLLLRAAYQFLRYRWTKDPREIYTIFSGFSLAEVEDTVQDLALNEQTLETLIAEARRRFGLDSDDTLPAVVLSRNELHIIQVFLARPDVTAFFKRHHLEVLSVIANELQVDAEERLTAEYANTWAITPQTKRLYLPEDALYGGDDSDGWVPKDRFIQVHTARLGLAWSHLKSVKRLLVMILLGMMLALPIQTPASPRATFSSPIPPVVVPQQTWDNIWFERAARLREQGHRERATLLDALGYVVKAKDMALPTFVKPGEYRDLWRLNHDVAESVEFALEPLEELVQARGSTPVLLKALGELWEFVTVLRQEAEQLREPPKRLQQKVKATHQRKLEQRLDTLAKTLEALYKELGEPLPAPEPPSQVPPVLRPPNRQPTRQPKRGGAGGHPTVRVEFGPKSPELPDAPTALSVALRNKEDVKALALPVDFDQHVVVVANAPDRMALEFYDEREEYLFTLGLSVLPGENRQFVYLNPTIPSGLKNRIHNEAERDGVMSQWFKERVRPFVERQRRFQELRITELRVNDKDRRGGKEFFMGLGLGLIDHDSYLAWVFEPSSDEPSAPDDYQSGLNASFIVVPAALFLDNALDPVMLTLLVMVIGLVVSWGALREAIRHITQWASSRWTADRPGAVETLRVYHFTFLVTVPRIVQFGFFVPTNRPSVGRAHLQPHEYTQGINDPQHEVMLILDLPQEVVVLGTEMFHPMVKAPAHPVHLPAALRKELEQEAERLQAERVRLEDWARQWLYRIQLLFLSDQRGILTQFPPQVINVQETLAANERWMTPEAFSQLQAYLSTLDSSTPWRRRFSNLLKKLRDGQGTGLFGMVMIPVPMDEVTIPLILGAMVLVGAVGLVILARRKILAYTLGFIHPPPRTRFIDASFDPLVTFLQFLLTRQPAPFFLRYSIGVLTSGMEPLRSADGRRFMRWLRERWQPRRLSRTPQRMEVGHGHRAARPAVG